MITGLKLTMSGAELLRQLDERIDEHNRRAEHWKREHARAPEEQTEDSPLLPDHMCENEAERHLWRAEFLAYIRDHLDPAETYHLGAADLEFAELLPDPPAGAEQDEYEQQHGVRFALERLAKAVEHLGFNPYDALQRHPEPDQIAGYPAHVVDETDEHRTSRLDLEEGPEIFVIEHKPKGD